MQTVLNVLLPPRRLWCIQARHQHPSPDRQRSCISSCPDLGGVSGLRGDSSVIWRRCWLSFLRDAEESTASSSLSRSFHGSCPRSPTRFFSLLQACFLPISEPISHLSSTNKISPQRRRKGRRRRRRPFKCYVSFGGQKVDASTPDTDTQFPWLPAA